MRTAANGHFSTNATSEAGDLGMYRHLISRVIFRSPGWLGRRNSIGALLGLLGVGELRAALFRAILRIY